MPQPRLPELDALDLQLLTLLEEDGRMALSALARRVRRSRSASQERVQRLERSGHIAGYTIRRGGPAGVRAYLLVSGSAAAHEGKCGNTHNRCGAHRWVECARPGRPATWDSTRS